MGVKRVLLLYISPRSGHHQASLAIEKALALYQPNVAVRNIDALHYMNPFLERFIKKTYSGLIRTSPEVWDYLYDNPKVLRSTQKLRHLIHRFHSPKFQSLLDSFRPDVIACTQAFPCGLVSDLKKNGALSTPLVGILTDYLPHSYWIHDRIDYFVVPSDTAVERLSQNGIPPDRIRKFGIPVDPKFSANNKKGEIQKRYNLDPKLPTLLLMGGSSGLGPFRKLVRALEHSPLKVQIFTVCGFNRRLYRSLKRREKRFKKRMFVLGYTEEVDALMESADILITKPGGLSTSEALTKRLPMILLDPIRGQESSNADFLVGKGLALKAEDEEEAVELVEKLLAQPETREAMRRQAQRLIRPESANEIASFLLTL